jgi:hypothetical protein
MIDLRGLFDITYAQSSRIINGSFDFSCVVAGDYTLQVTDMRGRSIHSEQITVRGGGLESVHITLSTPEAQRPASPWVSVRQLQRKTDKKAERELRKAHAAAERGSFHEAIQHSREALARDPAYPQAWLELGYANARMKKYEEV